MLPLHSENFKEIGHLDYKVQHSKVCGFPIHFLWDFPEGATFASSIENVWENAILKMLYLVTYTSNPFEMWRSYLYVNSNK